MEDKKADGTFQYLRNASSNSFETSEYVYYILVEHIELKGRKYLNFGSFDR